MDIEGIKSFYRKAGVKKRFKKVADGLWIYPEMVQSSEGMFHNGKYLKGTSGGIFLNDYDIKMLDTNRMSEYLINSDDDLAHLDN